MLDGRQRLRGQTVSPTRPTGRVFNLRLMHNFSNSWVDDISRVIKPADQAKTFRIRIRSLGQSNMDRVFVSEVRISGR